MLTLSDIHTQMGILTPFEKELESSAGIELSEANLIFKDGLAFVVDAETGKEYQATIHIKSQTHLATDNFINRFENFFSFGYSDSRRIHLGRCSTINSMIKKEEFWKYHGSYTKSHKRIVLPRERSEIEVPLRVCSNCIEEFTIAAKMGNNDSLSQKFDFDEFFKLNIGVTPPEAKQDELSIADDYPENWNKISFDYKSSVGWRCECCQIDLEDDAWKSFLQSHHIDKRKANSKPENLRALCKICHECQPHHGHMPSDFPGLHIKRAQQGLSHSCDCGAY